MAGVENMNLSLRYILAIAFGFSEIERQIILAPDHQKAWLFLPHPGLPFRIRVYIRSIVIEQIALNLCLARLIQKIEFISPEIRVIAFHVWIVSDMARPRRLERQEIRAQRAFLGRAVGPEGASRFPIRSQSFVMRYCVLNNQWIDPFGMDQGH